MSISMLYSPKLYLKDRFVYLPLLLSLGLILAMVAYSLKVKDPAGEALFLHYNIVFGVDLIGVRWELFIPVIIASALLLINAVVAWLLYNESRLLARFILGFLVVIQVAIFTGQFLIVNLNI